MRDIEGRHEAWKEEMKRKVEEQRRELALMHLEREVSPLMRMFAGSIAFALFDFAMRSPMNFLTISATIFSYILLAFSLTGEPLATFYIHEGDERKRELRAAFNKI